MKYIIDLPDNCSWVQWVMTSDKDGHAYFDFKSPEDLTTLDKELSEAYQKGLDEAWANVGECEDRVAKQAYQKGLGDAWKTIIKIAKMPDGERGKVFGETWISNILNGNSLAEITEKLKAHEQQKTNAEIKVGDEVKNTLELMNNAVAYFIEPTNNEYYRVLRYVNGKIDIVAWHRENCVRTGGHSYAVERMVGVMKGEQSCSSCEYSNDPDGVRCRDCCGYDKFEPKGSED